MIYNIIVYETRVPLWQIKPLKIIIENNLPSHVKL